VTTIAPLSGAPAVAEWTKIGAPDTVIALTGSRFSSYTGNAAGNDTQFQVFGENASGSFSGPASILRLDGLKAAVILPVELPAESEYLIWPVNSVGAGYPVAVNATEAWWIGPNAATRGDTVSVYGRNLAHTSGDSVTSYIYIQKSGTVGVWATVTAANPYKVDFTVPADLANGDYQVWAHNGHGGHYGWSGPLTLSINNGMPWTTQTFNVKNYGAMGDGVTDDEGAIEAAMVDAAKSPWSTIYLPTGTYMVSSGFNMPSEVRWLGDGPNNTFIKANAGFVKPVTDNPRRYCLFFSNFAVNNVAFQNMTIDANGNMNGCLNTPIDMCFDTDVRFTNVTINAKGYDIADFHGSNRVSFQNCTMIGGGSGIFFGTATQVFINSCQIFGTNDANTLLTWWGGTDMSCTNTTAQDYDNTQPDGWAQGRFLYGCDSWGSNRNIYVGNNTTLALAVRPGYSDQNAGEQILWENGTKYSGTPHFATPTTVNFGASSFFQDQALQASCYDAVIVNGTGLGQHRQIVRCAGSTITVSPAWNVPPDTSSTVIIAGVVSHCAVYNNSLQGKSDYATRATASAGIQPYGNSYDFIADNNTISQTRTGIFMWGMSETSIHPQSIACSYFNYVANNTITHCQDGIVGISTAWNGWPVTDPYPGISCLGNTCVGNEVSSMVGSGFSELANNAPIGDQFDLNVFDQNTVTNAPVGIDLEPSNLINNAIVYKNDLSLGTAAASGSIATSMTPALRQNTYTGFQSAYGVQAPAQTSEASSHVISVQGTSRGPAVKTSLVLWNAGASSLSWNASSGSGWLTASESNGSITDENGVSTISLTCNPANLSPGVYSGTVTVTGVNQVRNYTVTFTVQQAAATSRARMLR
jgi:hypothetical protein